MPFKMNRPHMAYFEQDDILHYAISNEPEAASGEVSPDVTAELNENGELIGMALKQGRFRMAPLRLTGDGSPYPPDTCAERQGEASR